MLIYPQTGGFFIENKKRNTAYHSNDGKYDMWFCFDPISFKPKV